MNLQYQSESQRGSLRVSTELFLGLVGPSFTGSTGATWAKILLQSWEVDMDPGRSRDGEPVAVNLGHQDKGSWVAMILPFFPFPPIPGLYLFSQNLPPCLPVCESGHPQTRVGRRVLIPCPASMSPNPPEKRLSAGACFFFPTHIPWIPAQPFPQAIAPGPPGQLPLLLPDV